MRSPPTCSGLKVSKPRLMRIKEVPQIRAKTNKSSQANATGRSLKYCACNWVRLSRHEFRIVIMLDFFQGGENFGIAILLNQSGAVRFEMGHALEVIGIVATHF